MSFRPDPQNSEEESTDLMLELQKLFKKIKEVEGTTEGITRCLCISNVYEQQDAVEYYQKILKAIGPQISKVFEGEMSNKTKCLNNHIFQEKCHFFTIPLSIEAGHSEVFNVGKGLQTFFKLLKLDADNWLYCKHCGQKAEAETWNEIEEFPAILTLYLKRFYFDYNQMRIVKNHCPVDILPHLQLNNTGYELYAVINHSGGESGGHYNAVIKSFEDDEWYCFDDSSVTQDSENSFHHSQLAYLLMYRKVDGLHPDEKSTNELQLHFQEDYKQVTMLMQWIRHYISVFEENKFPTSYKETETLCCQFLEFKMTQLPEAVNTMHYMGAKQAGQIKFPPDYNLIDVEKEWSQLHGAITKWERLLRNDFEQVYCFHERLINRRSEYNLREMSSITVSVYRIPLTHAELDKVMLCYIQDLLAWVEKNQRHIHNSEWGADLPSIESHLGSHHRLHQSIKDIKSNIDHAQADENLLTPASKQAYRDYLAKLDLQYNKPLSSSVARLQNLTRLHTFAEVAIEVLMWLSERNEEEIKYDWSDDNTNMTAKKDNYSALIAALQTQFSWLLQLCCCTETHLNENTAYFQFFADMKEAEETIKKIQETMKKKYMCDRSTTVMHLERLLQDAAVEKEQHLDSLNKRAKNIVQLKPRNPATPVKDKLLIQAVCDYKQREITVHRGDKCVLLNNSQPFMWKVKSLNGSKATVPSICFIIPPTNKEAVESSSDLAASWQELMILWQRLHVDMKSLLSWQNLMRDIQYINSWNFSMFKTQEYHKALNNLQQYYHIFMRYSNDSELFGADERKQAESAYNNAAQHYTNLLQSTEQGEQDDSVCKSYITQIKDLCLRLERYESQMFSCIRDPVDIEKKKFQTGLKGVKKDLDAVVKQSEAELASSQWSTWAPILRSEIDITLKKMEHVYKLCSVNLDKLKNIDLEKHSTQGTEDVLRKYDNQLCVVHKVAANEKELASNQAQLKKLCSEAEPDKPVEAELRDAMVVNECMFGVHSEGKGDHYVSFVASLKEGWQAVSAWVDLRLREVGLLDTQMQAYRQMYACLIQWIADAKQKQEKLQAKPINDNKALKEQLAQGKKLLEEIENYEDKVKECKDYAIGYMNTVKVHEHQLVTYKALLEPFSSTKVESGLDSIIQEIDTLETCYCEVLTLASQYINTDIPQYLEDKEKANKKLNEEERRKMAEMQPELEKQRQMAESHAGANAKEVFIDELEKQKHNIQQERQELRNLSDQEIKDKSQQAQEARQNLKKTEKENRIRIQLETTVKQKSVAEAELQPVRDKAIEEDRQEAAEKFRKPVKEETKTKRKAEEELKQKSEAEQEHVKQRQKAMEHPEIFKQQMEEAKAKKLAEDAAKAKECTETEATLFQQNTDEAEHQKQAAEGEAAKHAKAQEHTEKLRNKPEKEAEIATGGLMDHEFHLPNDFAMQGRYVNKEAIDRLSGDVKGFTYPTKMKDDKSSHAQFHKRYKVDKKESVHLLSLANKELLVGGLRKKITLEELLYSRIIDQKTYTELTGALISVKDLSKDVKKYLEGTSCIAGVHVEVTKERLSIYQAMKKNMITQDTAIELLEAQAATGYVIDPIKNLKLTVNEAVKMEVVGPEFKDKLLSAEQAVTGYTDPHSDRVISLFQAMKKGLIIKDHGIRLLEAQIATGGVIDPEVSHRLLVEVAYKRGLFDDEMNSILTDPSDDTKGFTDPNTEENLTYLQLLERCMTDPETGLTLLLLKEKKRERKTSSKSSVYKAYHKDLTDHQKYMPIVEQKCEREEITSTSKSMIIDRRSGHQYDTDDTITRELIDESVLDQHCAGTLLITESADILSGNMSGFRSHSYSFGSTSSYPMNPVPSIRTPAARTEEMGPVAGILDTYTLEKLSVTEAMHRNLVDSITGQRLLEAQACTGGIIDTNTGEKFTVVDAINKGLVDKIMVERIDLAQKAFQGIVNTKTKTKMSAAQALNESWLHYETGQRFLEVQYLTGGLIEPDVAGRLSLDDAVKKGTLDERTAHKLQDVSRYSKYLTCPKTKLKISYKDAMERSQIEEGSGLRLLEASSQSIKCLYSLYNINGSGST